MYVVEQIFAMTRDKIGPRVGNPSPSSWRDLDAMRRLFMSAFLDRNVKCLPASAVNSVEESSRLDLSSPELPLKPVASEPDGVVNRAHIANVLIRSLLRAIAETDWLAPRPCRRPRMADTRGARVRALRTRKTHA
jgi:hypothetical protein